MRRLGTWGETAPAGWLLHRTGILPVFPDMRA